MVQLYCTYCGDRLKEVTVVRRGVTRVDTIRTELRHATRRVAADPTYRPPVSTRWGIKKRLTLSRFQRHGRGIQLV